MFWQERVMEIQSLAEGLVHWQGTERFVPQILSSLS